MKNHNTEDCYYIILKIKTIIKKRAIIIIIIKIKNPIITTIITPSSEALYLSKLMNYSEEEKCQLSHGYNFDIN